MRRERQGLLSAGQSHVGDSEVAIAHSSICFGCCHCSISLQHLESDFIWKQKPRPGVPLSHTNRLILTPKLQSRQSWVTQEDPNTPGAQGTGYSVQKRMPLACNSNPLVHKELPVTWVSSRDTRMSTGVLNAAGKHGQYVPTQVCCPDGHCRYISSWMCPDHVVSSQSYKEQMSSGTSHVEAEAREPERLRTL